MSRAAGSYAGRAAGRATSPAADSDTGDRGAGTGVVCNDTNDLAFEKCNGIDDDCNGQTDEGYDVGAPCDGNDADACTDGTLQCISDTETTCTDNASSFTESCDDVDNDCDGQTDEGLVCCIGVPPSASALCQPDKGETCSNCFDCVQCGNAVCGCGETAANCPVDCQ